MILLLSAPGAGAADEFRGRMLDKPVDGFAADYLIEISELVTALPQIPAGCKQ